MGCYCLIFNAFREGGFNLSAFIIYALSSCFVIFLTLPIHEWAHGFVSTKLGDPTPRYQGRLTLNPMAHIDPIGALCILLFGIGWAKPVQVNARYYKNPKWGMALVAFAGPFSNVVVAFVSLLFLNVFNIFVNDPILLQLIRIFFESIAQINVYLAVFNLLPIPPFDGSRILFVILPQKYYFKIMRYEKFIFIGIFILLFTNVLDVPLDFLFVKVYLALQDFAALPFILFGV